MRNILLLVIIILAIFFRFFEIGTNPEGFFTDEASNGINAYKIATTGHDDHGKLFPVIFEANGDWRDPVYIYSLVPSVAIFGLSEFSVRIVSAIYGLGAVILIYFLGKEIADEKAGLLSALLLAITPWHVHFSRVGFQLIAAVFWILFSLLFLYKSLNNKKYYAVAAFGIILSFFSYSTTKLYIFPLILLFVITHFDQSVKLMKSRNFWIVNVISLIIVLSLIFPHIQDGKFFSRWNQVSHQTESIKLFQSYLNHFSYDFLFSKGDSGFFGQDVKRHSITGMGELNYFQLPFLIIGILCVIFNKKLRQKYIFFLFFLLLYPVGSVFTQLEPQATRSVLGVIPFTVFTAAGIIEVSKILKYEHSRFIFQGLFAAVIMVTVYILFIHIKAAPRLSADYWGWQYGYRPIMNYFTGKKDRYDDLLITHRFNAGADLLSFYNVEFNCQKCSIMNNPIQINPNRRQLFAVRNDDILEAHKNYPDLLFRTEKQIVLPNGTTELFIGEFVKF